MTQNLCESFIASPLHSLLPVTSPCRYSSSPPRPKSLLYGFIVTANLSISLMLTPAPHPLDARLLLNMLDEPSRTTACSWAPVCLPHWNDAVFVHVYTCWRRRGICVVLVSQDPTAFYEMSDYEKQLLKVSEG